MAAFRPAVPPIQINLNNKIKSKETDFLITHQTDHKSKQVQFGFNMEEETKVSSEVPVTTKSSVEDIAVPIKVTNGDLAPVEKEVKKEEEENALDGEFIKVERESLEVKDVVSHMADTTSHHETVIERSSSNSSRELLEAQEKTKELEIELERVATALKHSEAENTKLNGEILLTKEKLEETGKKYEDLELTHKKLQQQINEAEESYNSQINALRETLQAQEAKQVELIKVKDAFDGVSLEIETSRKRMQELENELQSSVDEAKKFEELHKQSGSHAESETQRALEFGKLLEVANVSVKEMEGQIASLQEELKGVYDKIAENQKVEEQLKSTKADLSTIQEELAVSRSQAVDLEHRLSSKETLIDELTQELDLKKASESQVKEDITALDNLLVETKDHLQAKVSELEDITLKLQEEVNARESVEAGLKSQEAQVETLQKDLANVIKEKEAFESAMSDLTSNLALMKEFCSELEEKYKLSDENFCKTDSLLSQALSSNAELEKKLKSLEELHNESGVVAATATQKNLELEDIIRASNEEAEEAKSQLREIETRFIAAEQKNAELEQQMNLIVLKSSDAEREAREFSAKVSELSAALKEAEGEKKQLNDQIQVHQDNITQLESDLKQSYSQHSELGEELKNFKERSFEHEERANTHHQRSIELEDLFQTSDSKVSELSAALKNVEEEKKQLNDQIQVLQDKITQLESDLKQSHSRHSELDEELKNSKERSFEHEERANVHHQRSIELEDLFQTSHSKVEEAGKKVNELELLLETEKYRIQELEEQVSTLEKKCVDAEVESKKNHGKISELASELEAFQARASSLEVALQMAGEKEKELTESLKIATDEKKKLEDTSNGYCEKLAESETVLEVLRNELNLTLKKLESIENDLKAAGLRESEVMEKLKYAEEELKQQGSVLEQATARNSELESSHESLTRESELKLQEVVANLTSRDSEAKSFVEKLNTLEDQVKISKEQVAEAAGKSALLKEELDSCLIKVASLESTNEELKRQLAEGEIRASNSLSEIELLVETNNQLKSKIAELQESYDSAISEKEVTSQQLASYMNTIAELTDQLSRASKLQSATEVRITEAETQMQEAIQRFTKRDGEANELIDKINVLEGQIKLYEEQAQEASVLSETRKVELEETLLKLNHLESITEELKTRSSNFERESGGLAETNLKITQDLASHETKLSDLQEKLSATLVEKDNAAEELQISKKAIEDLTQQLTSEGHRLQSQISSVMEENNLLNETYENAKKELQSMISQLEGKLQEQKTTEDTLKFDIESLKAEAAEKSLLQTRLKELEELLVKVEAQSKQEVENVKAAAAGREAELISKLEDHEQKVNDRDVLAAQVQQFQGELKLAQTAVAEQKEVHSQKYMEGEAALKRSLEELEAKNNEVVILEKQVKELEQQLQLANAKVKGDGDSPAALKDVTEIKSRDLGLNFSTPTKRKSKKKLEAASAQASTSSEIHTHGSDVSAATTFKFVIGVALVSVIIGIILGKRY
ncbi:hypothetical protein LWI29_015388 [Acer saccharum]|uniref:WIT1/2 N-terminal helical bundle domain-containing protein n=1 Tax=Acer saccharum TaxID=4024 RepID=A0AA39RYN3_ACESA|nr:hypothetical protein LWI29_015388 [Acer saccharum]